MLVKVLLLLLPAIVYGHISLRMKAGKEKELDELEVSGSIVEIIPDKEREKWQINDDQLKDSVAAHSGGRPSDVFVKSPTPWDDLYKRFGWKQVQRTVIPRTATITDFLSLRVNITTQEFVNNGTVKATYNIGITQSVEDLISSAWAQDEFKLETRQENTYKIEFDAGEVGGTSSISYKSSWGEDVEKYEAVTVGSTSGVLVELQPGQAVIATLTARRRFMEVLVDYSATLSGDVACNYAEKFNGQHFWSYDINDCLQAAGLPKSIDSSESIILSLYSDAKVTVSDKESAALIAEEKVPIFIE